MKCPYYVATSKKFGFKVGALKSVPSSDEEGAEGGRREKAEIPYNVS